MEMGKDKAVNSTDLSVALATSFPVSLGPATGDLAAPQASRRRPCVAPVDCPPLVNMNIIGMLRYLTLSGQGSTLPWMGDCGHAREGVTMDRPPVANKKHNWKLQYLS